MRDRRLQRDLVGFSLIVFFIILSLGTYDMEDVFHFQYSAGAAFGGLFNRQESTLIHTLLGVPIFDFGITGGYRLPFQGTLNTSLIWPLQRFISLELSLLLHLLAALVAGAVALSNFIRTWLPTSSFSSRRVRVFALLLWIALCYPIMEYLLVEDWYSVALPYLGFLVIVSGVLTRPMFGSRTPDASDFRRSLWFIIGGTYLLFLGHFAMIVLYAPWVLLSLVPFVTQLFRSHRSLRRLVLELRIPCLTLSLVMLRAIVAILDVAHEVLQRPHVSELGNWFATPTRSSGDFKHFLGQLFAVEFSPWLKYLRPDMLARFNISPTSPSRIPLSALLLSLISCFWLVFGNWERTRRLVATALLAIWLAVFLIMVNVVPFPVRASADYLYRDVLLVFVALAAALTALPSSPSKVSRPSRLLRFALVSALLLGPVATTLASLVNRIGTSGWANPYAPLRQLYAETSWQDNLLRSTGADNGAIAVIDPVFLRRYVDPAQDVKKRDWMGLRGYHQLRQLGFQSIEGFPKNRDASAFTGRPQEFQQRIPGLTVEHCRQDILTFLNVNLLLVKSGEAARACTAKITSSQQARATAMSFTNPRELTDSGMSWIQLSIDGVVIQRQDSDGSQVITCGVTDDPNCLVSLGAEVSTSWVIDRQYCGNRCLLTIKQNGAEPQTSQTRVLLPINIGNGIRLFTDANREIGQSTLNGLVVADLPSTTSSSVRAVLDPDWRMWLQVLVAWVQFLAVIPLLFTVRKLRRSRKEQDARLREDFRASG